MATNSGAFNGFDYSPRENPDWAYARNLASVLMVPSAEWVQSIYSCQFEVNHKQFIAPNRDYAYQGLLVQQAGENWKFIDCVALSLAREDGLPLSVIPGQVNVTPWEVIYSYRALGPGRARVSDDGIPISISYRLNSAADEQRVGGIVKIEFPAGLGYDGTRIIPAVQPFLDIRHMYSSSDFDKFRVMDEYKAQRRIGVSSEARRLLFYLPDGEAAIFGDPEIVSWRYKLGTGERHESFNPAGSRMETVFKGERKEVAAFFSLTLPSGSPGTALRLYFTCSAETDWPREGLEQVIQLCEESRSKDDRQSEQLRETFRISPSVEFREAIWARIAALTKIKGFLNMPLGTRDRLCIPQAGSWWFKTPWFRDVFEGLLNSFETLMKLPEERETVRNTTLAALRYYSWDRGLVSTRVPEFTNGGIYVNSSDATLLCFITANRYLTKTGDANLARKILPYIHNTVARSMGPTDKGRDGPPRVDSATGLVLSVPHHSWIDTRCQTLDYAGHTMESLPNRVSARFIRDLYDRLGDKAALEASLSSPLFFLPEINAQWIVMLKGTLDVLGSHGFSGAIVPDSFVPTIESLLGQAIKNFKTMFWNPRSGFLYNLAHEDGVLKDEIECESAITAAAMLGELVFSREELEAIWRRTKDTLLVYRRPVQYGEGSRPFGILARNEDQRIFYGDGQYHADVVWPRSTPYLVRLLVHLGEMDVARDILMNMLDHQMTEGAVFYTHELFSRPCGNNSAPDARTRSNPVPVKNPIQYWSQWCDPFAEFFVERS